MTRIAELAETVQELLTKTADRLGQETGFIKRQRTVTGSGFAQTLVFGWLANPSASYAELNQAAATVGMAISTQGLDQRFTEEGCTFLRALLGEGIRRAVTAEHPKVVEVLGRFDGVYVVDTSQVGLPAALAEVWPGGGRDAALKLALGLELTGGQMTGPFLDTGRTADQRTPVHGLTLPPHALLLTDLGFFDLTTLRECDRQEVYWLMRLKMGTNVYTTEGQPLDLTIFLTQYDRDTLGIPILVGCEHLPCRLLGWRVSPEVAQKRRDRAHTIASRKQQPVSQAGLALAGWTLAITNIPPVLLPITDAPVILATRWQIEVLFDLWKTEGELDKTVSVNSWRVLASVYAKLLALLIQHWITIVTAWQFLDLSLVHSTLSILWTNEGGQGKLTSCAKGVANAYTAP